MRSLWLRYRLCVAAFLVGALPVIADGLRKGWAR